MPLPLVLGQGWAAGRIRSMVTWTATFRLARRSMVVGARATRANRKPAAVLLEPPAGTLPRARLPVWSWSCSCRQVRHLATPGGGTRTSSNSSSPRHTAPGSGTRTASGVEAKIARLETLRLDVSRGSADSAWWDDVAAQLEDLVVHARRETTGRARGSQPAAARPRLTSAPGAGEGDIVTPMDRAWAYCLEFLEAARTARLRIPTNVAASLVEVAHHQQQWRHCLSLATSEKQDPVSYEMFTPSPVHTGKSEGFLHAADVVRMHQRGIHACRRLGHWRIALDLLKGGETVFQVAMQEKGYEPPTAAREQLKQLFVGCVREAVYACSASREWDRAILVFLRGLEMLQGLDLCGDADIVTEIAYCCGEAGQWSTSLRVLEILFDAFLDFDGRDDEDHFDGQHGVRTGACAYPRRWFDCDWWLSVEQVVPAGGPSPHCVARRSVCDHVRARMLWCCSACRDSHPPEQSHVVRGVHGHGRVQLVCGNVPQHHQGVSDGQAVRPRGTHVS